METSRIVKGVEYKVIDLDDGKNLREIANEFNARQSLSAEIDRQIYESHRDGIMRDVKRAGNMIVNETLVWDEKHRVPHTPNHEKLAAVDLEYQGYHDFDDPTPPEDLPISIWLNPLRRFPNA